MEANGRMCPGHPTSQVDQGLLARSEATSDAHRAVLVNVRSMNAAAREVAR